MPFTLYPRCLPFNGTKDPSREASLKTYLTNALKVPGVQFRDITYSENPATIGTIVQPDIWIPYDVRPPDPAAETMHGLVMTAVALSLQAAGIQVTEAVLDATGTAESAAVALGGLAGLLLGRALTGEQEGSAILSAGSVVGAILGAMLGGAVGSRISNDRATLGIWRPNAQGGWNLVPSTNFVPPPTSKSEVPQPHSP
jgi:hypothetical protein